MGFGYYGVEGTVSEIPTLRALPDPKDSPIARTTFAIGTNVWGM